MYARRLSMHLKADSRADFARKLESDIVPLLRKQKGFQDALAFVSSSGKQAFAISLWDSKESAEAYDRGSYPEVTKMLSKVVDGTVEVKTYEVLNSTWHKIAAQKAA